MEVDDLEQNLLSAFNAMNTSDKDDLVRQFQSLIGQTVNQGTCEFFLEMNSWNLQQSICSYYDLENNQEHLPQMCLVQDSTIGDSKSIPPKTKFVKTWKIKNPGLDGWPPGCALRFTGNGHQMSHIERIALPSLKPGDICDASIEMESPEISGMYQGQWRMCSPTGIYCGETIWVILQVDDSGIASLAQQLSTLPLSELDVSKSSGFGGRNLFASSAEFPGNNSPTGEAEPDGEKMEGAWD